MQVFLFLFFFFGFEEGDKDSWIEDLHEIALLKIFGTHPIMQSLDWQHVILTKHFFLFVRKEEREKGHLFH